MKSGSRQTGRGAAGTENPSSQTPMQDISRELSRSMFLGQFDSREQAQNLLPTGSNLTVQIERYGMTTEHTFRVTGYSGRARIAANLEYIRRPNDRIPPADLGIQRTGDGSTWVTDTQNLSRFLETTPGMVRFFRNNE